MLTRSFLPLAALVAFIAQAGWCLAETASWEKFYQLAEGFQSREALAVLDELEDGNPSNKTEFARAVMLLDLQPKTASNVGRAEAIFKKFLDSENASEKEKLNSLYFLGRIHEIHIKPADLKSAGECYLKMFELAPADPLAQRAYVKTLLMQIFDESIGPSSRGKRAGEFVPKIQSLTDPFAKAFFYKTVTDSSDSLALDDATTYRYLLEQADYPFANLDSRKNLIYRLGRYAADLGKNTEAIGHFQKFLKESPRDARRMDVKERIAALAGDVTYE